MIPKKTGGWRMAIEYRSLKKLTVPMSYPLPHIESVFDALGGAKAKYFTNLDLKSSFWQIPLDEDTYHKSAFISQSGVYEWNRMSYGLINAAITFQCLMTQVLRGQKEDEGREYVVAYGGKALSGPEKSYHTSEKECLAILRGVEAYRPYLANSHFTVVTDHSALTWLKSAKLSSRLKIWALKLQDLNYDIIHRPGKSNVVADCLSRRPYKEAPTIQSVSTANPTTDSRLESDTDLDTNRISISGSGKLSDGWRTVTEFIYDDETSDSCPIISAIDIEELPQALDNPVSLLKNKRIVQILQTLSHIYKTTLFHKMKSYIVLLLPKVKFILFLRRYYDPNIHRQRYINPQVQNENDEGLNQNEHALQPPQIDNEMENEQVRNQVENEDTKQIAIEPNNDPPKSQVDNHSSQNRNKKFGFHQIKKEVFSKWSKIYESRMARWNSYLGT
ncbi:unnamed protein product [Mytilus coruscus]|uniref:Reverse transcriptase domain-containing protein n=1 Tax=Mytilus coruscus TaxID=42192 RepID=A0A6J8BKE3_MYTCO|nr:unnamed protein product [Mytilus coruscus]